MLVNNFEVQGVIFQGEQGYACFEYGYNPVPVQIKYHSKLNKEDSIAIKIGDNYFSPESLEYILQNYEVYKNAIKHELPEN